MSAMSSPDCRDRNHTKCNGDAWDLDLDRPAHCPCPCHAEVKSFHDYGVAVTEDIVKALSEPTPDRRERRKQERERRKQERAGLAREVTRGPRIDYHADSGRHIVVHPEAIPTVTRVLRREGILPGIPTEAPPVDPDKVKGIPAPRTFAHPDSPTWNVNLDAMPVRPEQTPTLDAIYAWASQRAIEQQILEEMAEIIKSRPKDAPGLLIVRDPEKTYIVESQWLPSGTAVFSMHDQPDLMVKIDPDAGNVLYYRQTVK